jgi:hypothetical protein
MMMVSEKRLRANHANAQKSTAARTRPAKPRSTSNAQRIANFRALFDLLIQRFEPVDDFEIGMIEGLVAAYNGLATGKMLDLLHQEENRLHKAHQRTLQNLLLVPQLATHVPEIFPVNEPISTFDINESSPGESHSNPLEATFAGTPSEPPALLPAAPDLSAKPAGAA